MRPLKCTLLHLLNKIPSRRFFKFYFDRFNNSNLGMVITLHRITNPAIPADQSVFDINRFIEISAVKLDSAIRQLQQLGVQFVSLDELNGYLCHNQKPSRPVVHISFDDGYLDNFTLAYPLLEKYHIPFSVFVASDYIDNEQPFLWWYMVESIVLHRLPVSFEKYGFTITENDYQQKNNNDLFELFRSFLLEHIDNDRSYFMEQLSSCVKQVPDAAVPRMMGWQHLVTMVASGLCELGIHTDAHSRFCKLNLHDKREAILLCKNSIRTHTGVEAVYFSYPYGTMEDIGDTEGMEELLATCGIQLAFTTEPGELNGTVNNFFIPRVFLTNAFTGYTLRTRLNGTYQRGVVK